MRPVSFGNCRRPFDHRSDVDCSLRFSERVRSAGENLKPLVQVGKSVGLGSQSGGVGGKTGYRGGATLRGFDSIMFEQADGDTCQGISGFGYVESMGLSLLREE